MFLPVVLAAAMSLISSPPPPNPQKPAAAVQKAAGSVEWTDAAGDVAPQNTSDGKRPGFDVVKLSLISDGTALTIAATLVGPPKVTFASDVIRLYLDTDNNPATGVSTSWSNKPGFELRAELTLCIEFVNGSSACGGGVGNSKVKAYYSTVEFGQLVDTVTVKGFYKPFREPKGTVNGAVVTATLPYADLGVKPGQTIRIVARESDGPFDETADFPIVLFTLK